MRSVLFILPALAACQEYQQHRVALVPHAAPLPYDGQPMQSQGSISIGADSLFDVIRPSVGDPTQGDEIPATQLRGQAAIRVGDMFSVAGIFEHAITQTATVVSPTSPKITDASLSGAGLALRWSTPTSTPGLRVAFATELVLWNVPYAEFNQCVQPCTYGASFAADNGEIIPTLGVAVITSYRTGRMTYFGGATLRNQPTITELNLTTIPDNDGGPSSGKFNLTLHAGVGVDIGSGVQASAFIDQTIPSDPVSYGPSVGMQLEIPLGDRIAPRTAL